MDGQAPERAAHAEAPARPRRRSLLAVVITIVVIFLPAAGAFFSYVGLGLPIEWDLVIWGTIAAMAMSALGWLGAGARWLWVRSNRPDGKRSELKVEDPRLIAAVLAAHDIACGRCGYNLRGLSAGACPECQAPIAVYVGGCDTWRRVGSLVPLVLTACVLQAIAGGVVIYLIYWEWNSVGAGAPWDYQFELLVWCAKPTVSILGVFALAVVWAPRLRFKGGHDTGQGRGRVVRWAIGLLAVEGLLDLATWITMALVR